MSNDNKQDEKKYKKIFSYLKSEEAQATAKGCGKLGGYALLAPLFTSSAWAYVTMSSTTASMVTGTAVGLSSVASVTGVAAATAIVVAPIAIPLLVGAGVVGGIGLRMKMKEKKKYKKSHDKSKSQQSEDDQLQEQQQDNDFAPSTSMMLQGREVEQQHNSDFIVR